MSTVFTEAWECVSLYKETSIYTPNRVTVLVNGTPYLIYVTRTGLVKTT